MAGDQRNEFPHIPRFGVVKAQGHDRRSYRSSLCCRTSAVAIAATPSPRPVNPRPSVVVADTDTGAPRTSDSTRCASSRRGPIFGRLPITWTAALPIVHPASVEQPAHLGEHGRARCAPSHLRPVGTEDRSEVAETGRGQQRVAQGVRGDVAVRVARASVGVLEQQSGHPARPARLDGMHVRSDSDTHDGSALLCGSNPGREQCSRKDQVQAG